MSKIHVTTNINGEETEYLCQPNDTLLDVLRNELNLTGTKEVCSSGDCGACSVTLNDRLVCSCLVLAAEVQNKEIKTIEGMTKNGNFHILQKKVFLEHAALQCGICTPGMLVAAKALLDKNPSPTETEIRFWLAGNLCRCTGYDKIVRAVQAASERAKGDSIMNEMSNKWIGKNTIRPDGAEKVTGRAEYAADTTMPGMIWGKFLEVRIHTQKLYR